MPPTSQNQSSLTFEVIETPEPELLDFFEKRIEEFNLAQWEVKKKVPIAIKISSKDGDIVGGAAGKTFGLWLMIDNLWVHENFRGQDLGTQILSNLEKAAIARGCSFSLLDTLAFQARPFYEKFGYTVQWIQKNYPREGQKFFMVKELNKNIRSDRS